MRCDVTVWEDQVALFDAALSTFKAIDVVVANAGVNEHFGLGELQFDPDTGKAKRPDLLTTEVNIVGVMYSAWIISSLAICSTARHGLIAGCGQRHTWLYTTCARQPVTGR
jgi:NAD(P)-dependent dehydrogenase (short-subunit alcohol dehydrogenase family)